MAEIRPFRALRFTPEAGKIEELTCPPYDIISESQRQAYLARNPHNIVRLELPRDGQDPYREAGDTLRRWIAEGILRQDDKPALYVYEIEFSLDGPSDISGMSGKVVNEFGPNRYGTCALPIHMDTMSGKLMITRL